MSKDKKKLFLICPVRNAKHDYTSVVEALEQKYEVHWPKRDTNQQDTTGLRICKDNRQAIKDADVVGVIWDGESQGALFDLGMTFVLEKKILIVQLPPLLGRKSFQDIVWDWAEGNHVNFEIMQGVNTVA